MKTIDIIAKLTDKTKGSFFKLAYESSPTLSAYGKKSGKVVRKQTVTTARYGLSYANLASVKERLGDEAPQSLPWGHWIKGFENVLIENNDKVYLRLYTTPNEAKVSYTVDGEEVSKEELQEMGLVVNSYWKDGKHLDCYSINVDNVKEIF